MTRYRARKGKADRLQELRLEVVCELYNLSFPLVAFHFQKDPMSEVVEVRLRQIRLLF